MKRWYVRGVRALRAVLQRLGVLRLLDRLALRSRWGLWVRSLLSIYDLEDLLELDVPWWTFESADRVEAFLRSRPSARVFEWGSGASSVWLGRRAGSVISVEHDPDWGRTVSHRLADNGEVVVVEPAPVSGPDAVVSRKAGFEGLDFGEYVAAIDATEGDYDLIVIDGRAREACLAAAVHRLRPGGLIVFDNVDRQRYVDAIARSAVPLSVTWTRGLTPSLPYPTRTALLRRA